MSNRHYQLAVYVDRSKLFKVWICP